MSISAEFILFTIGSYLFGSVPSAYLAGKWFRGIDIRQYGTGNVGLGNLIEMTSKKAATPVIVFDFGKGMAMVWASRLLGMDVTQQVVIALAVVIGHNWPVFLRFNGGRGVLTALGMVLVLMPWGIIAFGAVAIFTLKLKSSPLPVLGGIAVQPLISWALGEPLAITLGFVVLLVIIVVRRLTASKLTGETSKRQLLLYRLLYDRDIKDREEWVYRIPEGAQLTEEERLRIEKKRQKKGMF